MKTVALMVVVLAAGELLGWILGGVVLLHLLRQRTPGAAAR